MNKNKLLILPDIHGRIFWKEPCQNIEEYDKVIFLGDYLEPYKFEKISVKDAIDNFKGIIDCHYAYKDYFNFSFYHCRHSVNYHNIIANLFRKNINLFQIAYVYKDILFTHAGVESKWLTKVVKCESDDINEIASSLNKLTQNKDGLRKLYMGGISRGGRERYPSCIWADVEDIRWDVEGDVEKENPIHRIKQIFGHTLQAFYDLNGNIVYGNIWMFELCKMLDNAKAYILDVDKFTVKEIK